MDVIKYFLGVVINQDSWLIFAEIFSSFVLTVITIFMFYKRKGGSVNIAGDLKAGDGNGGNINVIAGDGENGASGGDINTYSGNYTAGNGTENGKGGDITFKAGDAK